MGPGVRRDDAWGEIVHGALGADLFMQRAEHRQRRIRRRVGTGRRKRTFGGGTEDVGVGVDGARGGLNAGVLGCGSGPAIVGIGFAAAAGSSAARARRRSNAVAAPTPAAAARKSRRCIGLLQP